MQMEELAMFIKFYDAKLWCKCYPWSMHSCTPSRSALSSCHNATSDTFLSLCIGLGVVCIDALPLFSHGLESSPVVLTSERFNFYFNVRTMCSISNHRTEVAL
jgi:hypothetical protein